jgi:hypothetical protein
MCYDTISVGAEGSERKLTSFDLTDMLIPSQFEQPLPACRYHRRLGPNLHAGHAISAGERQNSALSLPANGGRGRSFIPNQGCHLPTPERGTLSRNCWNPAMTRRQSSSESRPARKPTRYWQRDTKIVRRFTSSLPLREPSYTVEAFTTVSPK